MTKTRTRILGHACELFIHAGFGGFSMRCLARRVGVTAPALYRHFANREEVLFEVFQEAFDELFRRLTRALAGATPLERFEMADDAYMDFALDHPRYFQMLHSFRQLAGLDRTPAKLRRRHAAIRQFWTDRVRECTEAGIFRPESQERIMLTCWGHAYGLLSLYTMRTMGTMPREVFRREYRASRRRVLAGVGVEGIGAMLPAPEGEPGGEAHAGAEPGAGRTPEGREVPWHS